MLVLTLTQAEVIVIRAHGGDIVIRLAKDDPKAKLMIQADRDLFPIDRVPAAEYPLAGREGK